MAPVASGPWQLLAEKVKMPGFGFGSIRLPRRKLPCVSGNEDEPKALLGCGEHVHIDCRAKGFETDYDLTGVILGKGCSGSVREVVCRKTGKFSAVKTFDVEDIFCAGGPDKLRDLQREVALQASIDHPGVARVEAVYESKGFVRVVMERLEGGELFNRVSSYGPMGEREASELTFNLLKIVAYLHSQHIVHRDIKLENLIFEHSLGSNFKLIDFGFAASFEPGDKLTERCGTLQYMAPEVFKTSGYDEKVDMWSIGCTVYVMLTARSLYKGGETAVLEKSQEGKVDWSSRLDRFSEDARDFLFMLLNVDPSRRPRRRWGTRGSRDMPPSVSSQIHLFSLKLQRTLPQQQRSAMCRRHPRHRSARRGKCLFGPMSRAPASGNASTSSTQCRRLEGELRRPRGS